MTFESYEAYCSKLDRVLKRLYQKYMGQERTFAEVVPGGAAMPPHRLAESVAQVLTLQMNRMNLTDKELRDIFAWIRAACLYLHGCPEDDWRMKNLIRLAELDAETREFLPIDELPEKYRGAFIYAPLALKEPLEKAVWLLAEMPYAEVVNLEERLWPKYGN